MKPLSTHHSQIIFVIALTILYYVAWQLQQNLLLNSDVSWLLEASRRMLHGGAYQKDYFEVNPPMILYFYLPAAWSAEHFHVTSTLCLRLYIFLLSLITIYFCTHLSKYIFIKEHYFIRHCFLLLLTILFCIFPIFEFAQRDVLFFQLAFPYFLLTTIQIGSEKLPKHITIFISFLAGIGFALKPFFLIGFVLLELYYYVQRRAIENFFKIRVESLIICLVLLLYVSSIVWFHKDYLTFIMPFVANFYYKIYFSSLVSLLMSDQAIYFYFSLLLLSLFYKKILYPQLFMTLLVLGISCLISYVTQGTNWYYHVIPVFAAAVTLFGMLFFSITSCPCLSRADYLKLILWCGLYGVYLIIHLNFLKDGFYYYSCAYFALFGCIMSFLFYVVYGSYFKTLTITFSLLLISFIFYKNLRFSIWYSYTSLLISLLLMLSFALLIPTKSRVKSTFFALFGLLLFVYPFYWSAYLYKAHVDYKQQYLTFVEALNDYNGKSLYFITDSSQFAFPALDYTHQYLASRFASINGMPVIHEGSNSKQYRQAYEANKIRINLFLTAILDDFKSKQPDVILVDVRNKNVERNLGYFGNNQIDYIQLFSFNKEFKSEWDNYHYIKTIDGQPLYKFNIYKRGK